MHWPNGKRFAFTIFDDPDSQTLTGLRVVYDFLAGLGFRTTVGVWPCAPVRPVNSPGETCASEEYRRYVQNLQKAGFEVGYHHTTPHSSTREEIAAGFSAFYSYFGHFPITMSNHYNAEAIYWGSGRLSGARNLLYRAATSWRSRDRFFGDTKGSPYFWGDLCRSHVRYCRSFVYTDIDTLRACPQLPYRDPDRQDVNYWFASSDGETVESFVRTLSEENQDRLEAQGGACIIYAHFAHGFVRDGNLDPRFRALMERLSRKNGWFAPVSTVLDYLRSKRSESMLTPQERAALEWRWVRAKLLKGVA